MNDPDKSYITDCKDYDGRIFWAKCLTECAEISNKCTIEDELTMRDLINEDKIVIYDLNWIKDRLI